MQWSQCKQCNDAEVLFGKEFPHSSPVASGLHATGTRGIQIKCSAINAMMSLFYLLSVAQSEQCNPFLDNLKNYTTNPRTVPFLLFFGEQKQVNCLVDRILRCSMY
jgi:hypothetical protein